MSYQAGVNNKRRDSRVAAELSVKISIGTQFSLNGQLKDLSSKSAYIRIKSSIYFQVNDEVGFAIQCLQENPEEVIQGLARISRLEPGEGFAIYFTKMDEASSGRLKDFLKATTGVCM